MKKQYEKKTPLVKKALSTLADKEAREWPPTCIGFFYQPARPQSNVPLPKKSAHKNF